MTFKLTQGQGYVTGNIFEAKTKGVRGQASAFQAKANVLRDQSLTAMNVKDWMRGKLRKPNTTIFCI